jgi:hypothetical protein
MPRFGSSWTFELDELTAEQLQVASLKERALNSFGSSPRSTLPRRPSRLIQARVQQAWYPLRTEVARVFPANGVSD